MSTTPNTEATPTVEELQTSVAKLTKALESEREAHKTTRGELAGLSALAGKGDLEKVIGERLAPVAKERDDARAKLADVESRWAGEKVDRSLSDSLSRSGMIADNAADALALARPLFALSDKGEVVTKADAAGVIPGASPDQWIVAQLRTLRPHWWPKSVGGGATGGARPAGSAADDSCFKPGATWNLTAQAQFERRHGTRAAETAARRYGTTPFGIGRGR
ncbi:MAG: hypothetical protein IT436_04625 [Phycisphaerales bacterium]|nr:hypothetical protein [Phycisphaerales bacterium]